MDGFDCAAVLLPPEVRSAAERLPRRVRETCEEFRLRRGSPPTALLAGREEPLCPRPVDGDMLRGVLASATRSSLHAAEEELRNGFLSAPGGVRVGVCGVGVCGPEGVRGLRDFSSVSIRVPRAVQGCADGIWAALNGGGFQSLLIVSPPGAGKTTLLRELVRRLSGDGLRVCAADERGELAGTAGAGFDVGPHTDVMSGVPKAAAVTMLLRAMNPQVIAMDEIGDEEEAEALRRAVGCGVTLLASAHGQNASDAARRPGSRELLRDGAFRRCVTVSCHDGIRRYRVEELS